ncbi:MAG TPA: heparinase II/III family protein [bacterium]|nr:heparinase II/III family protein [bacterium]
MAENFDWMNNLKKERPRLILNDKVVEDIKTLIKNDDTCKKIYVKIKENAEKICDEPVSKYEIPDGLRLLYVSIKVLNRVYTLSLVYKIEGNKKYLERLWNEIYTAGNFPDWNPKHFLDTAEMAHAFAIAYDWCYYDWTEDQRKIIREALLNKALKVALDCYEGKIPYGWWTRSKHNWNQVCNGGIGIACLSLLDEYPEICSKILDNIMKSLPLAMKEFAPDGGWGEGPGYWAYATEYNFIFLTYLDNCINYNFDFWNYEGVSETGFFPIYITGPVDKTFNFADSGDGPVRSSQLFYLSKKFKKPVFAWYPIKYPRYHPLDLIWFTDYSDSEKENLPLDKYFRYVEVVTMRTSWNNRDALFVGFKGGRNNFNHSHLDIGSFVFDAYGYRWIIDLGLDNYNLPGYFGKNRWDFYRLRAEGHNTIVINPSEKFDQEPDAISKIVNFGSKNEYSFAISDLTDAYRKYAKSVKRGILLNKKEKFLLIQDEIELKEKGEIWWFLHTGCDIEIGESKKEVILKQKNTELKVKVISPSDAQFLIMDAKPLSSSPNPTGQNENKGIKKIALNFKNTDNLRISVILVPLKPGNKFSPFTPSLIPLNDWQ